MTAAKKDKSKPNLPDYLLDFRPVLRRNRTAVLRCYETFKYTSYAISVNNTLRVLTSMERDKHGEVAAKVADTIVMFGKADEKSGVRMGAIFAELSFYAADSVILAAVKRLNTQIKLRHPHLGLIEAENVLQHVKNNLYYLERTIRDDRSKLPYSFRR